MKKTIDFDDFVTAFRDYGRADQFSEDALSLLFDYLEQIEVETGQKIELDVIALCCEYSEDTVAELAADHDITLDEDDVADLDEDERADALMGAVVKYLCTETTVCGETADTIVYVSF